MYQPIVDRTGVLTTGVEALLRWQYRGQPVSPGVFIPVAEKSGSIHEIGAWVLRQACLDAGAWPGLDLSVNVSAVQFGAPDLAERIERIVEETGFDWKRLQLEITETALFTAEEQVFQVMKRLRGRGASFALDDFGTGYSSLTYLRRFPFDKIKIDQSFIADVSLTVNASIVHAVISIGRSLGLKVVAEGVESTDQRRFLTAAGVHYMQGYLFGHPVAPDEINDRLFEERQMIRCRVENEASRGSSCIGVQAPRLPVVAIATSRADAAGLPTRPMIRACVILSTGAEQYRRRPCPAGMPASKGRRSADRTAPRSVAASVSPPQRSRRARDFPAAASTQFRRGPARARRRRAEPPTDRASAPPRLRSASRRDGRPGRSPVTSVIAVAPWASSTAAAARLERRISASAASIQRARALRLHRGGEQDAGAERPGQNQASPGRNPALAQ